MTQLPKTQLMVSGRDEGGVHTEVGMGHVQVPTASSRKDLWDWRKPGNCNEGGSCPSGLSRWAGTPQAVEMPTRGRGQQMCGLFSVSEDV